MTTASTARKRGALFALLASFGLLAVSTFAAPAQEAQKPKDDKAAPAADRRGDDANRRDSVLESGYTRPGNIDDKWVRDGEILPAAFRGADVKKFKIMGGTVYFTVFKNTGLVEGDTFATGMSNFDRKFRTGRSFKDSYSPRYDDKAKYLYLYQVINDRGIETKVAGANKGDQGIAIPVFNPKAKPPVTDDIASFALKLIVDPRYITSWGHFAGAGFAANVLDVDAQGKLVKQVVDDGKNKVERDKEMRLAFSYLPAIVSKITNPAYHPRNRSYGLGDLDTGLGVDQATRNLQQSKAFSDLKLMAGQAGGNVSWASFANNLLQDAEQNALEPEYVQLMYMAAEERAALDQTNAVDDDFTRAIFRADWNRINSIKQGDRSVVFGFTTDLPPVAAPIRIDTPKGAALSEGMQLANYFTDEGTGRAPGEGIVLTAGGGVDATALALSMGTALGSASSPAPAAAGAPGGFAGITGGGGGGMGGSGGGGMMGGGMGMPGFSSGFSRMGGGFGGGGGIGSGGGQSGQNQNPPNQNQNQTPTQGQAGVQNQTVNFNASLTNQQAQAQAQAQLQFQGQRQGQGQHQHGGGHHHHGGHHGGHVVPAPASLLLGLLGLPGLYFFRRRKTEE